jgi:hypothetical protein
VNVEPGEEKAKGKLLVSGFRFQVSRPESVNVEPDEEKAKGKLLVSDFWFLVSGFTTRNSER